MMINSFPRLSWNRTFSHLSGKLLMVDVEGLAPAHRDACWQSRSSSCLPRTHVFAGRARDEVPTFEVTRRTSNRTRTRTRTISSFMNGRAGGHSRRGDETSQEQACKTCVNSHRCRKVCLEVTDSCRGLARLFQCSCCGGPYKRFTHRARPLHQVQAARSDSDGGDRTRRTVPSLRLTLSGRPARASPASEPFRVSHES
eukprot:754789-Hanusia_phi.AAC.1